MIMFIQKIDDYLIGTPNVHMNSPPVAFFIKLCRL